MSARDSQFRSSRAQSRGDSTKSDKRPSTSLGTSGKEAGFTLLEMLVALAVFSLAALALLRLEGATVRQTGELDERMLAQLVARNLAVETLTDPAPPPLGASTVLLTLLLFVAIYTVLLIIEWKLMFKAIRKGPLLQPDTIEEARSRGHATLATARP